MTMPNQCIPHLIIWFDFNEVIEDDIPNYATGVLPVPVIISGIDNAQIFSSF